MKLSFAAGLSFVLALGASAAEPLGRPRADPALDSVTLDCASAGGRYTRCTPPTPLRVTRAELSAAHGGSSCRENTSWGWDDVGVWVDQGCRGSFVLFGTRSEVVSPIGRVPGPGGAVSELIRCESVQPTDYRYCPATGEVLAARLQNRYSRATCDEGRDWGWDEGGVWVANGCSADFAINDPRDTPPPTYPNPNPPAPYPGPRPPVSRPSPLEPEFLVGSELWRERGFDDRDQAVALCARRVTQAAWRDADFSAQYDGYPTVEPWWGDEFGPSFRPDAGAYGAPGWRISGAIVVFNRGGFERWSTTCVVDRGAVATFNATPLGRR